MKVSIITVTYNSENYLQDCITSVTNQRYSNKEYIVVDGRSTDNTAIILNNNKTHINKLISEKDSGIYDAMNKGINLATGDVIGILNSDDVYADDQVLNEVMQCFVNDPNLDMVYANLVYVKRDDLSSIVRKWNSQPYHDKFFEQGHVPPHPTLFLKKQVYEKAGGFNTSFLLAADYEFMLRVFKKYKFKSKHLNRLTIIMRLGGATSKNFKNIWLQNKEILSAWKLNKLRAPSTLMFQRIIKRLAQFI
jgi:glycosyltransferase involved in cell wall biosynthesis